MSVDYAAIIAVANGHLQRAEPEEMAFRHEVLDLEESALWQAAIYEVAHTLGVGMGLLTGDEQKNPGTWDHPEQVLALCIERLSTKEIAVENFVSQLSMEYEFGVRVGMELGLALAKRRSDA